MKRFFKKVKLAFKYIFTDEYEKELKTEIKLHNLSKKSKKQMCSKCKNREGIWNHRMGKICNSCHDILIGLS